jgi:hypothetical protein
VSSGDGAYFDLSVVELDPAACTAAGRLDVEPKDSSAASTTTLTLALAGERVEFRVLDGPAAALFRGEMFLDASLSGTYDDGVEGPPTRVRTWGLTKESEALAAACPGAPVVNANRIDRGGDGRCDRTMFWDADCSTLRDEELALGCGATACDLTAGVCEPAEPCGRPYCLAAGGTGQPVAVACPNDPDCAPARPELPGVACEGDGHCDPWCPDLPGTRSSIDPDCAGERGAYCPGGAEFDRCR